MEAFYQKELTDRTINDDERLAWRDPKISAYEAHLTHLRGVIARLGKTSKSPQVCWASEEFRAELRRALAAVEAAEPQQAAGEAAREAFRAVVQEQRALEAREPATDVDGELRRIAERNVMQRAVVAAREAFTTAILASQLPPFAWSSASHRAEATSDTRQLAALSPQLEGMAFGLSNQAARVAEMQGSGADVETARYWPLAELDYPIPLAAKAFEARWFFFARRHGIPCAGLNWEQPATAAE